MTQVIASDDAMTPSPRRRLRPATWVALAASIIVLAAGGVTGVEVAFHYLHAAPLQCACGLAWAPPDNRATRLIGYDEQELVVPPRPGQAQTFYVEIVNRSPVTQTVLGLPWQPGAVAEPTRLSVSATPAEGPGSTGGSEEELRYVPGPVSLPPGQTRYLRYTIHTQRCWSKGRSEIWNALTLRVRVGAFTRSEDIPLGSAMVIHSTRSTC